MRNSGETVPGLADREKRHVTGLTTRAVRLFEGRLCFRLGIGKMGPRSHLEDLGSPPRSLHKAQFQQRNFLLRSGLTVVLGSFIRRTTLFADFRVANSS